VCVCVCVCGTIGGLVSDAFCLWYFLLNFAIFSSLILTSTSRLGIINTLACVHKHHVRCITINASSADFTHSLPNKFGNEQLFAY